MKLDIFDKLQKNLEEVSGTNTYNLSDVLTIDFIRANTTFGSYDDMIGESGLELTETTVEDLCSNEELNKFIKENTPFENFEDMYTLATTEYVANKVTDL